MISQIPAAIPNVAGWAAEKDQGETVARPIPGPSVIRIIDTPKAASALSFPKIPSAGDLASDFPCSAGNNSLLAPENSLFRCVGNLGVSS